MPQDSAPSQDQDNLPADDILAEIKGLFDEAEGYMKSLEHVDGLFVPTVNQLRYVGRHLVDHLNDPADSAEQLRRAKGHCQRAIYDANDAHIQYSIEEIQNFINDFSGVQISDLFKDYPKMIKARNAAVKFLEQGRIDEDNRELLYQASIQHKKSLEKFIENLPLVRDELNKRVESKRSAVITRYIGYALAVIAIGAGIYF